MKRGSLALVVLSPLIFALACEGERALSGLGEPIRVRNGVFKEGPLPSSADPSPAITSLEIASAVLRPGQGEKSVSGRASPNAVGVAVAIGGLGSGYWLLPVEGPDPLNNGELGWSALAEIGRDLPAGRRDLLFAAIDGAGRAGAIRSLPICIPPETPDNLNACDPSIPPPAAVLSLVWDTAADVDLVVVTPEGRVVDAKHPTLGDAGAFDRDSNAACANDAIRRENLVFQAPPPKGSYLVFGNLFSACEHAPVRFRFTLSQRSSTGVVETVSQAGVLTAVDANGGASLGTFIAELSL